MSKTVGGVVSMEVSMTMVNTGSIMALPARSRITANPGSLTATV